MGVPKFFRYISERYPCLSELVKEYQIPDFDNLYLDMNGIIHTCSHPDDFDPHFRISEEKIFQDIFQYIELLFRMIKPQKLFFMAIDGVAPRAKMNQQRGRRFRSAKEAEMLEEKAKRKGEVLPPESRFDSNCITPGTVFMVRLHEQLKYFVTYKISTDRLWQNCKVILSGHETPGEGEHKIMDYIRYMKSQPGYDPNTRHCLYGLDADLIMLGLCTHEPHFSLLREEVKFGKKAKRKSSADGTNFYLLHLSLMREYLELEFITVKEKLPFEFDLEKIIDDWVLMGFLVGNDFIPHLPNFHITNGALPLLYDAYIKTLPNLEGYINESGTLNLQRFEKFMEVLSAFDLNTFSETYADLKYFEEKTGRKFNENKARKKLEPWDADEKEKTDKPRNSELESLIQMTEEMLFDGEDSSDFEDYSSETENDDLMKSEFQQHKTDYYMNKLDYASVTPEVLRSQAEGYVRAIQWNLHYYYDGVCSWSWYYPHHYAPFISDIKGFSNLSFEYKLGSPFLPFEQLLAVLPAASKTLLPEPYQELMTLKESPIINYYPVDFDTDLNGKKQEWEAVVLIPFIDEKELLDAMKLVESRLTPDEVKRNSHGPMMVYEYTEAVLEPYKAPEYFQTVKVNHAKVTPITNEDIRVPKDKLIKGVCPGVKTDVYYPGFPTMKHLKYTGQLRKEKVKVFDQPSRGENMILTVEHTQCDVKTVAKQLLGKSIYVNWPHLTEAKVMTVSDSQHRYHYTNSESIPYVVEENKGSLAGMWMSSKKFVLEHYMTRLGIDLGDPDILVHVLTMIGRKYIYGMAGKMTLEKQWADIPSTYAYHAVVSDISVYDPTFIVYKSVTDIFTIDSACFLLGYPYYGAQGKVIDTSQAVRNGRIKLSVNVTEEPNLTEVITLEKELAVQFMPGPVAAQRLAISPFLLSRITGTIFIISGPKVSPVPESANKTNIGLNLKFNKRNEEVPGYTKKNGTSWLYSLKAVQLINDYMNFCPQLFDYLSRNTNNDMFFESEVFTTENEDEPLKRIATWIKEQPFNSIEHQTCGSKVLDPQTISTLEKTIETYLECVKNNTKTAVIQVKPQNVLKPELHQSNLPPDPNVKFNLFDRIVNIRESHVVPVGLKGTIIAIHQPKDMNSVKMNYKADIMFDVVFDEPFVGGLALNCSSGKGYRISSSALINISYGVRSTNEKSNNTIEPAAPQMNTSWGKPKGPQVDPKDLWQQFKSPNENPQYVSPQLQNKTFMPQFQPQQILQNSKRYFPNSAEKNFSTVPEQLIMKPFPIQGPSQQNSQGFVNLQPNARPCSFQNYNKPNEIIKTVPNTAQVQRKVDTSVDVSTNVLKNLLKISTDNDQKGPENVAVNPIVPPELLPQNTSVQNFFKQTNLKPSEPACVKLLSLYQRNGMGIPRYNYINGPNGTIQAQIFFPNRKCFTSNFSTSREMASESVAMLALLELEKESDQFNRQVQYIPPPPQQWYQRNIPQSAPMQNKQPFNKPRVPMQIPFETKPASSQEAFVPLQAIKQKQQQQSRTNVSENKKQSPEKRVTETQNVNQESNASSSSNAIQFGNGKDSKQSNKSKQIIQKKRKCRIAANFNVNQQK